MERDVRYELVPVCVDTAIEELRRDMLHLADCAGADEPPRVVEVEVIALMDDASAFLIVIECGTVSTIGIPICIKPAISVDDIMSRLGSGQPLVPAAAHDSLKWRRQSENEPRRDRAF